MQAPEEHPVLLSGSEKLAVREGRLSAEGARRVIRRRLWAMALGVPLGYAGLWLLSRLL